MNGQWTRSSQHPSLRGSFPTFWNALNALSETFLSISNIVKQHVSLPDVGSSRKSIVGSWWKDFQSVAKWFICSPLNSKKQYDYEQNVDKQEENQSAASSNPMLTRFLWPAKPSFTGESVESACNEGKLDKLANIPMQSLFLMRLCSQTSWPL